MDEFDKVPASEIPAILDFIQELRQLKEVSVVLTGNQVAKFDPGLLRPGRINIWEEFKLADATERRLILASYLDQNKVFLSPMELQELVRVTEGLSNDYLRDAVERMTYMDYADMLLDLGKMRERLGLPPLAELPVLRIVQEKAV
jgi:SpoVK/Ycf46/Vps4 family AAA+-type ATPase